MPVIIEKYILKFYMLHYMKINNYQPFVNHLTSQYCPKNHN